MGAGTKGGKQQSEKNEFRLLVQNRYTERDGAVGGGEYHWANGKESFIIDVGLPCRIIPEHLSKAFPFDSTIRESKMERLKSKNNDKARGEGAVVSSPCSYAWEIELEVEPSGEPLFDGHWAGALNQENADKKRSLSEKRKATLLPPRHQGPSFEGQVLTPGTYLFTVTEDCALDQTTSLHANGDKSAARQSVQSRTALARVHFMPVRRELRSLFPFDRNKFLDAFRKLWVVPTFEGRRRWGQAYLDVHDLSNVHRQNAGTRDADHFHEGSGFLPQHAKISRRLEQSLQAQDPSLALPYWDTSIEMEKVRRRRLRHVKDSPVWSSQFFGSSGHFEGHPSLFSNDEAWRAAAILNGRWAFTQVPRVGDGSPWGDTAASKIEKGHYVPRNSYGYLRSPWNQNPSPYVTRFMDPLEKPNWASCRSLADTLATSLAERSTSALAKFWSYTAQFPPHAHAGLHDYIGGTLHSMQLEPFKLLAEKRFKGLVSKSRWKTFEYQWFVLNQKGLWRSWLTEFPNTCDPRTQPDPTSCVANCTDRFPREVVARTIFSMLKFNMAPEFPLGGSWWLTRPEESGFSGQFDFNSPDAQKALDELGHVFCANMGVTLKGENFESSGVLDPSFWVIHPTTDRLFQASVLAHQRLSSGGRGGVDHLNASEVVHEIWPPEGTFCGSLADCLTCHVVDSWLLKSIRATRVHKRAAGGCLNPGLGGPRSDAHGVLEAGLETAGMNLRTLVQGSAQCCYGHGSNDRLFTQYSPDPQLTVREGPTNRQVVRMLLPNQGPQWDLGGTVVFDHFKFDHCTETQEEAGERGHTSSQNLIHALLRHGHFPPKKPSEGTMRSPGGVRINIKIPGKSEIISKLLRRRVPTD